MTHLADEAVLNARLREVFVHEKHGVRLAEMMAVSLAKRSVDNTDEIGVCLSLTLRTFAEICARDVDSVAELQRRLFKAYATKIVEAMMASSAERARLLKWVKDLKRDMR